MTLTEIREAISRLVKDPCECEFCDACAGCGEARTAEGDMEDYDECSGEGVIESCDRCILLADLFAQQRVAVKAERLS